MVISSFDVLTGRVELHLEEFGSHKLHPEVLENFIEMAKKASEDDIDLKLVSAFRNFQRQQIIWNDKATGNRKILNDAGEVLDITKLDEASLAQAILRFSALPGASRHHWGTDIDVFDANVKNKQDVELTVQESLGEFQKLNLWLDSNMQDFGFYRPYSQDRGGVSHEPWHLSYFPLSRELFEKYDLKIFRENIQRSEIELKDYILSNLDEIFERYISNIEVS